MSAQTGMPVEGSPTVVAARRNFVASARLRGATLEEIRSMLAEAGFVNHSQDGKPYSIAQIWKDIQFCRQEWLRRAADSVKEHYTRILAELQEVKKSAWARGDLSTVTKVLAQECKIFGFNSPLKIEVSVSQAEAKLDSVLENMTEDELRMLRDVHVRLLSHGADPVQVGASSVAAN